MCLYKSCLQVGWPLSAAFSSQLIEICRFACIIFLFSFNLADFFRLLFYYNLLSYESISRSAVSAFAKTACQSETIVLPSACFFLSLIYLCVCMSNPAISYIVYLHQYAYDLPICRHNTFIDVGAANKSIILHIFISADLLDFIV